MCVCVCVCALCMCTLNRVAIWWQMTGLNALLVIFQHFIQSLKSERSVVFPIIFILIIIRLLESENSCPLCSAEVSFDKIQLISDIQAKLKNYC